MSNYQLKIKLLSDTTFGRGDGVAGLIDQEVEHDQHGFPYLRGRTLKGLLSEESDNLIAVLPEPNKSYWQEVACQLFGIPGSTLDTISAMHMGDACLPEDLRQAVAYQLKQPNSSLKKADILNSLTTIRRQTAIHPQDGVADERSLRSARVVVRHLCFTSFLIFESPPTEDMLTLLSVGTLALRRLGSRRNRGRGHVECTLCDVSGQEIVERHVSRFGEAREDSV